MPDDQNTTLNTPAPDSPQNLDSTTPNTPPEAQNAPGSDSNPVSLKDTNEPIPSEPTDLPANPASNGTGGILTDNPTVEPISEPTPEPVQTPISTEQPPTAQIPVNEPLPVSVPVTPNNPVSSPSKPSQKDLWKRLLDKVQIGKRKKLDRVMEMFAKQTKITNDEVEKFLHVSDATAERYLNILEKENKIKQVGKTGHSVSYTKI
ncbi:MAG: hypothetical protein WAN61_02100 [Minisyncoccia bacterium]